MIKNLRKIFILFFIVGCATDLESEYDMNGERVGEVNLKPGQELFTGWAQSGDLITGNTLKNVSLQAQFGQMGNYTVQFNINQISYTNVIDRRVACQAEVIWKVRGNHIKRIISVSDGTAITGAAEAVEVKLTDASPVPPGTPVTYVATIQVSKGTRGTNKQPPYLAVEGVQVAPGGTGTIIVPADAGINSVFVLAGPVTEETINEGLIQVTMQGGIGLLRYDPRDYDWVPIDPGVDSLRFDVAGAGVTNDVLFTPFFGIDG